MDAYPLIKTVHIVSATVLFGTGLGIAFFMLAGMLSGVPAVRRFAAAWTVRADFVFTLPAVLVQPLSGAWLVWRGGFDWGDCWLVATYALYVVAGLCWLPVVAIQIRLKRLLATDAPDEALVGRLFRWWFALGWPAFGGLVLVFHLMVAKPSW
ncbi:DUF2269 family protein [Sphingomonas lenta]|uniref:DUF2269 domain-containing protein n=1 Tax=Sphingomonas lenta TaxID=1141887 RepID=A0A2A2SD42_9SPHN|nr:DUF2269 domain-containing protein [Sphingomonas lenta]PAX07169.1 hypothetical protein CKY28_14115 [Sphingomonas lenta]